MDGDGQGAVVQGKGGSSASSPDRPHRPHTAHGGPRDTRGHQLCNAENDAAAATHCSGLGTQVLKIKQAGGSRISGQGLVLQGRGTHTGASMGLPLTTQRPADIIGFVCLSGHPKYLTIHL